MSTAPTLTEKLANVQHMPSLIAATIASDKPTDLYLVRDIIKMSYESVQTRVFLQKYFNNLLLTSRNVYVKIKVLKLIVTLLEEGHPEFHRNLQKTPEAFKESARLKATDPAIAGDCGRIRDLAEKVLDKLYEDPPEERQCPYGLPAKTASISSSGSGSHHNNHSSLLGGGGGGGGALGGRIQGFGTSKAPQTSSVTDQIGNAMGSLFGTSTSKPRKNLIYDEKYATMDYIPQSSSVGRIGGVSGGVAGSGNRAGRLPYTSVGSEHQKGRPGGGWSDEEEDEGVGPVTPPSTRNGQVNAGTTPTRAVDNEQERKLVEDITTPGGIRVAPPKEDLVRFISRCKTLDCLAVVEFLRIKLQSENSQILSKALFVLEALARSDIEDVYSYLDLTLDELTHLSQSSPHASVRAKSTKLLHQLSAVDSLSIKQEVRSHNNGTGDLLGEVGGANNDIDQSKEQSSELSGLFSGLTVSSSSTATKSPPSKKTFSKPAKNTGSASRGLLEDMTLSTNSTSSSTQPTQPAERGGDLLDLSIDKEDGFDPLASTDTSNSFNSEMLGGLSSLEEPFTSSTSSADPLQPTRTPIISTGSSLIDIGLGGAPVQTTPHMPETMTTTMQVPAMMMGPMISGPQGGYQPYPPQFMYNQALNRPVQILPKTQTSDPGSDSSGFGFLSKSSGKATAFDFVQDEMKASMNN